MTDASTRSTFFTLSKAEISVAGSMEESRECSILRKKGAALEKRLRHTVPEMAEIPRAQAATAWTRKEKFEPA